MNSELCWYNKYYLTDTLDCCFAENQQLNTYLNKLSLKSLDKNIENKVNQIEKEYQFNLKEMYELCDKPNIIELFKTKNSLTIIQKELEIIKLLTKYILQNNNLNYVFFISCLEILYKLSDILRIRLKQNEIFHDKQVISTGTMENIIRCSYKFCSYKDNCNYNYNNKNNILCYQDHYVHNMVSADLSILINYIKKRYDYINNDKNPTDVKNNSETLIIHNKEILKTINTLSYVIGHMESELKNKCIYLPEAEWETCHIIKNTVKQQ